MTESASKSVKIKVGGVVANGEGGYFDEGELVEGLSADNVKALKSLGYI